MVETVGTKVWCYDKDIFGFSGRIIQRIVVQPDKESSYLIARDYDGAVFYRTVDEFEARALTKATEVPDNQTLPESLKP